MFPYNEKNRFKKLWLSFSIATIWLLFAYAVSWHIDLPGLYMDAVNPDFQVVDVLQGKKDTSPMLYLPGNLIAGRIPLLTSMYHGTQNIWVDLPVVATFGANIASLRAAQALFGIAILTALFFFLGSQKNSSFLLVWLPAAALALDPVFIYAFRTQLYITLGPVAWLLSAILAVNRGFQPKADSNKNDSNNIRLYWFALAGFCYGAAVFGYFIFSFFFPVLLVALVVSYRVSNKNSGALKFFIILTWTFVGFLLGIIGYIVGYLRILWVEHGFFGFLKFFSEYQHSLSAFDTHLSLLETVSYFSNLIWRVFSNDWQHALIFGDAWPEPGSILKLILLLGLPLLILVWCEVRDQRSWRLLFIIGLLICFPTIALIFGNRLSGHHFVGLLPLAYVALATGLIALNKCQNANSAIKTLGISIWLSLIFINIYGQYSTGKELLLTHGRNLFSDAINNFAHDAIANESENNRQKYYFPDWGLYMPFHFLTNGKITHTNGATLPEIRHELCNNHTVSVAFVTGNVIDRANQMATELSQSSSRMKFYDDYEGNHVFLLATFSASPKELGDPSICSW